MTQILQFVMFVIGALVASMFAVGKSVYKESDGNGIHVTLTATVEGKQLAYVNGWAGITGESGNSGETIALDISGIERQFEVPAGLAVNKGDKVYIDTAQVTGHTPNDAAYSTSSGAGKIPVFKATSAKDGNNVVTGILIVKYN